jgi:hypothetical protein
MKPFHFSGDYGQTLDRLVTTEKMSATYMEVVLSGDKPPFPVTVCAPQKTISSREEVRVWVHSRPFRWECSVGVLVMEGVLVCPEEVSLEKVLSAPRPSREETSVSPHKGRRFTRYLPNGYCS